MPDGIKTRYAIVGAGAAGIAAVEALRSIDRDGELVLINGESTAPYCRPLIVELLTGERAAAEISIRAPEWYRQQRVKLITGDPAMNLDPGARRLRLESGRAISWEKLLLAPGSLPAKPPIDGLGEIPAFHLASQADVTQLKSHCRPGARALLVGIGLIGLQALTALKELGVDVVAVEACPKVLPMILDAEAARYAQRHLSEHGIAVHVGTLLRTLQRTDGRVLACDHDVHACRALTSAGDELGFDFLVLAAGMRPNLNLVADSDIAHEHGIIVSAAMETSVPDIYAAGDVTQFPNWIEARPEVHAHWVNAHHQGRIAGIQMAGGRADPYAPIYLNSLRVFDLPIITMGASRLDDPEGADVHVAAHPRRGAYTRLVVKDGQLIAATFVRDVARAGVFQYLMRERIDIGEVAASLLAEDREGMEYLRGIHESTIEGRVDWPASMDLIDRYRKDHGHTRWGQKDNA